MNEQIKKHTPTAAIVTAGVVALRLVLPASSTTIVQRLPEPPTPRPSGLSERQIAVNGQALRLVSCGDSRNAIVQGADEGGNVALGPGARGMCTVIFARPWVHPPSCTVKPGRVATVTTTDLIVDAIDGAAFSYRCAP